MAGLHTSYRLAPYPGVGKCVAKHVACPVGGAQQHLYNDYLSDEAKQALAEDRPLSKAQMLDAIQKAKATPGSRLQIEAASLAQHNMMMHGYLLNSYAASFQKQKSKVSKLSQIRRKMKKVTAERVEASDLKQNLEDKYGMGEGLVKFTELTSDHRLLNKADEHKTALSEYARRFDMETNSHPINNKKNYEEPSKGEKSDKWYARALSDGETREARVARMRARLQAQGKPIPDILKSEYKWGEGIQRKMEGAVFIPDTSIKGKVEVGSGSNKRIEERDVSFKELAKRKEFVDQQKANKKSAQNHIETLLAFSANERIRNGEALGESITMTAHGRQVSAKINYSVPVDEEIEKLPTELQEKITDPATPTLTMDGVRAALESGRITQEQFDALSNPTNELNIISLRDMKAAAKKNSLKVPVPDPNKSVNNAKDMTSEIKRTLENYAETAETFEKETGGNSLYQEEKWVKESTKALKDGVAEKYNTPNLNFIAGAEDRGASTSIVQSTRNNLISSDSQKTVLGAELYDSLVKDFGIGKAKVNVDKMKKELTKEQLDKCLGYGVSITDKKDPKLVAKEKKQAEQAAAKKQREADRKKAATAKRREAEAAKKRAAAERKKAATAKRREAEAAKKRAAAERKKAATAKRREAEAAKKRAAAEKRKATAAAKKATAPKTAAPKATTTKASAPKPAATKAAPAKKATAPKASAPKAPAATKATAAKPAAKTATAKATAPKAPAAPKAAPAKKVTPAKAPAAKPATAKATAPKAAPAKKATAPKTAAKPAATKATTAKAPAAPKAEAPAS